MEEEGGTPVLFPAYIEKAFKDRTLAYFEGDHLITETGDIHLCPDFSTFLCTTFEHNLLVFLLSVPTFPFLEQAIAFPGNKVLCTEEGKPIGIRLLGARRSTRWVVSAASWGAETLSLEWLQLLREVYDQAGVGVQSTPGSLGMALFRKSFEELHGEQWREKRLRRPPGPFAEKIRYESSGARSEVFQLNVQFDIAYENDQHNGYGAALAQFQPAGKTYRVRGAAVRHYAFYFVECEVTIHNTLDLGVFPVRVSEGRNRHPVFPRDVGMYRTWLWNTEIKLAEREGCHIKILSGYGWKEATSDFQPFVQHIATLRDQAPPEIRPYFKLALVAMVGRLGMSADRYKLVAGDEREEGDRCVCDAGIAYDWWIHQEHDSYPQSMPHIFSHTLMLCRVSLYEMAKRCMQEELNVIATNTDAIITEYKPAIADKGEQVETGEWTALELHHVIVTANRHLDSDEKSVHPGIPKKKKGKNNGTVTT